MNIVRRTDYDLNFNMLGDLGNFYHCLMIINNSGDTL